MLRPCDGPGVDFVAIQIISAASDVARRRIQLRCIAADALAERLTRRVSHLRCPLKSEVGLLHTLAAEADDALAEDEDLLRRRRKSVSDPNAVS